MSQTDQNLRLAVQTFWNGCGEKPPIGDELAAAAITLGKALEVGRKIPRITDKTFQPLVGPRRDLEVKK